jgi:hypothetical protein
MVGLLILPGGVAVVTAGVALWLAGRRRIDRRYFAGSVAIAVSASVFSVIAWVTTAIMHGAPLPLIWAIVGAVAVVFAVRLYRELHAPPSDQPR